MVKNGNFFALNCHGKSPISPYLSVFQSWLPSSQLLITQKCNIAKPETALQKMSFFLECKDLLPLPNKIPELIHSMYNSLKVATHTEAPHSLESNTMKRKFLPWVLNSSDLCFVVSTVLSQLVIPYINHVVVCRCP